MNTDEQHTDTPPSCENCGNDDATHRLWLCLDCAEGLPDA